MIRVTLNYLIVKNISKMSRPVSHFIFLVFSWLRIIVFLCEGYLKI